MLNDFIDGYTYALLELESQDGVVMYEDLLSEEATSSIKKDCASFYQDNSTRFYDDRVAGVDFYLTRNGHGAGFWDGDYSEEDGKFLTERAHEYGAVWAYIGDDNKIYLS